MFFVIDKSKIYSYIIAICTVVILFVAAAGLNDINNGKNTVITSTNVLEGNSINILNNGNNLIN